MRHWLENYQRSLQASFSVTQQERPIGVREIGWTLGLLSTFAVVRALLTLPAFSIAKWYASQFGDGGYVLLGNPRIVGDIAANFAQARALMDPSYRAYDELSLIFPLIGLDWDVNHGTPRLPTEIPLYIPVAAIDYYSPVYQAIAFVLPVISILALAWCLRLQDTPVFAAWAVTALIVVSPIGRWVLESTYPFIALAIAASWRFRNRPFIAALGLVFAGAGRGVALLVSLYFVAARKWRTISWLVALMLLLFVVALAFEQSVLVDFLDRGLYWGQMNSARPDNASLASALVRPIYAYIVAAVIFVLAARRASALYWSLVWLSAALAPIAWTYAAVALLPLAGFLWSRGKLARLCVVSSAVVLVSTGSYAGLNYTVIVLLLGIGLVAASWDDTHEDGSLLYKDAQANT